jgi:DNA-binding LacI/PurR family transcriptional regulator
LRRVDAGVRSQVDSQAGIGFLGDMGAEETGVVTMATLAKHAGVSKNTVSLALRGDSRIPPGTRQHIEAIAVRLGYRKNPVVAHLMSELRRARKPRYHRTLALLNGHLDRHALTKNPTVSVWARGCRRRGESQGYRFDEFWLHDPELNASRLLRILKSRGIDGAIVLGAFHTNHLPERFAALWSEIPCVVAGVRTHQPTLSFCCVDHHALMLEAVERVLELGYSRPALVLSHAVDELVEGRFSAGMWRGQLGLPVRQRIPSFDKRDSGKACMADFLEWMRVRKPDVIFTLHRDLREWLEGAGYKVPEDVGLVALESSEAVVSWASMDQRNDLSGEAAVDMVVSMIHNNESGIPEYPRAVLGSSHWLPGKTVVDRRKQ